MAMPAANTAIVTAAAAAAMVAKTGA